MHGDAMTGGDRSLKALTSIAVVAFVAEAALYSTVAPLLPHYRDEFGLSTPAAGVLTASYTAGMIVGSIAGAGAAGRFGSRRTVVAGLLCLAGASVLFGMAGSVVALDASRSAQGFGAGLIWSGMLAWLIAAAPNDRRGRVLGAAMGAAIFGTVFGPVLGTIAAATGPQAAFAVIGAAVLVIVAWVLRVPAPHQNARVTSNWRTAGRSRQLIGLTLVGLIPGIVFGTVNALVPLRLDTEGVSEAGVGAVFLVGALVAAAMSPVAGRAADTFGRVPLVRLGLAAAGPILVILGLANGPWAIAALTIVTFGFVVTAFSVPMMALLSEVAERAGLAVGPISALLNLTYGVGETIGAPVSTLGAAHSSDGGPFIVLGALAFAALLAVGALTREAAPSAT